LETNSSYYDIRNITPRTSYKEKVRRPGVESIVKKAEARMRWFGYLIRRLHLLPWKRSM
jgi:hypothetical protein